MDYFHKMVINIYYDYGTTYPLNIHDYPINILKDTYG